MPVLVRGVLQLLLVCLRRRWCVAMQVQVVVTVCVICLDRVVVARIAPGPIVSSRNGRCLLAAVVALIVTPKGVGRLC